VLGGEDHLAAITWGLELHTGLQHRMEHTDDVGGTVTTATQFNQCVWIGCTELPAS